MDDSSMQSKILILGNGPINEDIASDVDSFDRVVRFNFCSHMPENLGSKCTDLWLTGRGRQALALLDKPINPRLKQLSNIVITDPPPNPIGQAFFKVIKRKGKIDYGELLRQKFLVSGESARLTSTERDQLLDELLLLGKPAFKPRCASSGLLAMKYFLQHYNQVHIAGFGFKGWKRHPWQQEKQYVTNLITAKKVIPLVPSSVQLT